MYRKRRMRRDMAAWWTGAGARLADLRSCRRNAHPQHTASHNVLPQPSPQQDLGTCKTRSVESTKSPLCGVLIPYQIASVIDWRQQPLNSNMSCQPVFLVLSNLHLMGGKNLRSIHTLRIVNVTSKYSLTYFKNVSQDMFRSIY